MGSGLKMVGCYQYDQVSSGNTSNVVGQKKQCQKTQTEVDGARKDSKFSCPYCSKVFARQGSLVGHIRVHTGERPHQCQTCGRRFSDSSSLTKHIRTHTGEKPFLCSFCHRAFSISHNLTRHLKLHSSDRHSKLCSISSSKSVIIATKKKKKTIEFNEHKTVLQPQRALNSICRENHCKPLLQLNSNKSLSSDNKCEQPLECNYCKLLFLSSDGLKEHLKSHSGFLNVADGTAVDSNFSYPPLNSLHSPMKIHSLSKRKELREPLFSRSISHSNTLVSTPAQDSIYSVFIEDKYPSSLNSLDSIVDIKPVQDCKNVQFPVITVTDPQLDDGHHLSSIQPCSMKRPVLKGNNFSLKLETIDTEIDTLQDQEFKNDNISSEVKQNIVFESESGLKRPFSKTTAVNDQELIGNSSKESLVMEAASYEEKSQILSKAESCKMFSYQTDQSTCEFQTVTVPREPDHFDNIDFSRRSHIEGVLALCESGINSQTPLAEVPEVEVMGLKISNISGSTEKETYSDDFFHESYLKLQNKISNRTSLNGIEIECLKEISNNDNSVTFSVGKGLSDITGTISLNSGSCQKTQCNTSSNDHQQIFEPLSLSSKALADSSQGTAIIKSRDTDSQKTNRTHLEVSSVSFQKQNVKKTRVCENRKDTMFSCPFCSKVFARQGSLVGHIRVHTGERPHQCQTCGRRFSDSSSLTKHIRTHTGEKPFLCSFCHRAFSISHNLTRHLKLHSRDKYSKSFLSKTKLMGNLKKQSFEHKYNKSVSHEASALKSDVRTDQGRNKLEINQTSSTLQSINSFSVIHSKEQPGGSGSVIEVELQSQSSPVKENFNGNSESETTIDSIPKGYFSAKRGLKKVNELVCPTFSFSKPGTISSRKILERHNKSFLLGSESKTSFKSLRKDFLLKPGCFKRGKLENVITSKTTTKDNKTCFLNKNIQNNSIENVNLSTQKESIDLSGSATQCKILSETDKKLDLNYVQYSNKQVSSVSLQDPRNPHNQTDNCNMTRYTCGQKSPKDYRSSSQNISHKKQIQKLLQCRYCNKTYMDKMSMALHVCLHSGSRMSRGFHQEKTSQYSRLKQYLQRYKTRNVEKPFPCPFCGKVFARQGSLVGHIRVHTGERPHQCQTCGRRFSDSSSLTKHIRTHTGEKPFLCSFCHRAFSISHNLTRHLKLHSSDKHSKPHLYSLTKRAKVGRNVVFKCQFCELVFQTSSSLKSHLRTHSIANSQLNTRSFQCKYCKLRFLNFSVLRIHLKTHIKKNKHSEQNHEKFKTKVNDSYIVELSEDCKVETNKGSAEDNGPLLQQFGANQATYSQDSDVKKSQTYSASQIGNIPPDVNCITAFVSSKTKSVAMVLDKNMSCSMDASQNIVSNETDFQRQLLQENTSDSNFVKVLQMDSMLEPLFDNHQQPIVFNKCEQENCDTVQPPSIQQNYTSEQWFTNERKHLKQEFNNSHSETLPISIHVDVNKTTELDAVSNSTIKSDKKQQCSHCQKIFLNVDQLSSHQLLEHSDASSVGAREIAKHVCLVCMVSFPTLAELQLHSKICCRNNGNKFTCSFCGREFSRNSGLIGHLRTHTRERPYVCATCNRRFSDSSSLTKHNRTHTGEKPFKCKHCFRAFSISHNLTRHLKLHERV